MGEPDSDARVAARRPAVWAWPVPGRIQDATMIQNATADQTDHENRRIGNAPGL